MSAEHSQSSFIVSRAGEVITENTSFEPAILISVDLFEE
jgi:hypothetical protein